MDIADDGLGYDISQKNIHFEERIIKFDLPPKN
jgi:hypothetical protein